MCVDLNTLVNEVFDSSLADSTWKCYTGLWNTMESVRVDRLRSGQETWNWPIQAEREWAKVFTALWVDLELSRQQLKRTRSAVKILIVREGWNECLEGEWFTRFFKGLIRKASPAKTRSKSIATGSEVACVIQELMKTGEEQKVSDGAAIALLSFGFLRANELFKNRFGCGLLAWSTRKWENVGNVDTFVPKRKNDTLEKGWWSSISNDYIQTRIATNAVRKFALWRRNKFTWNQDSIVFVKPSEVTETPEVVTAFQARCRSYVKEYLHWAEERAKRWTVHSLRHSAARFFVDKGFDTEEIKKKGGWNSAAVKAYLGRSVGWKRIPSSHKQ